MVLSKGDITFMLRQAKHFLSMKDIKYVTIDVEAYKRGGGYIDFSTQHSAR